MANIEFKNLVLRGIAACVPSDVEDNKEIDVFPSENDAQKFIETTGIEFRHLVNGRDICTSDMCYEAAADLMKALNWQPEEVECLIFVTQTPDYILPSTAPIIQHKLGLGTDTYCMDISLGCSGWVYGLSVVASLLSAGGMKKALLLAGDTTTVSKSKTDKSTYPLFGDAGTATALEFVPGAEGLRFNVGTDGKSSNAIIIPDGGFRNFVIPESFEVKEVEPGISRNRLQSVLDGPAVFTFSITKAPRSVNTLLEHFGIEKEKVDYFVFHQANLFMIEKIRNKLKIPAEKVPYTLHDFGNTSSASIPLTIVARLTEKTSTGKHDFIACGFGVGLSWGTVHFTTNDLVCPPVRYI